jgi:2-(1,2-epoxy-1,2-dihydrophenyl)acetyl-CoA isomerase
MEIAAFDRPISPARALEWGLVTEVVEEGRSMKRAMELSGDLCIRAGSSFAASKELLNDSFESPLERHLERERACLARCADSPNGVEGISAFVEKRTPSYR